MSTVIIHVYTDSETGRPHVTTWGPYEVLNEAISLAGSIEAAEERGGTWHVRTLRDPGALVVPVSREDVA